MKIRSDFVTNSSSSSFIVGFNSEEELESIKQEIPSYYKDMVYEMVISDIIEGKTSSESAVELFKENISMWNVKFKNKRVRDYDWKDQYDETTEIGKCAQIFGFTRRRSPDAHSKLLKHFNQKAIQCHHRKSGEIAIFNSGNRF